MIRAVIIEDEPLAARYLEGMLVATHKVEIAGRATDASEGLQICAECQPDAVFLDVRMPGNDGVSLAWRLQTLPRPPMVVFTTGSADRAADAFRVAAVDYLLKPLSAAQVTEAVDRLEKRLALAEDTESGDSNVLNGDESLVGDRLPIKVPGDDVVRLLTRREVVAAVRRDRRTWIHTVRTEIPTNYSVADIVQWLGGTPFLQVSREAVVNMHAVENIVHYGDRLYQLHVRDRLNSVIEVSRSGAGRLAAYLKPGR